MVKYLFLCAGGTTYECSANCNSECNQSRCGLASGDLVTTSNTCVMKCNSDCSSACSGVCDYSTLILLYINK
ncbi:MAG: hypothetical protein H7A23_18300 [Leptospiraceae bacterium]|nr:hypothetical protein [Leptospiraceae bacterium]MCP5496502.1 hypothetical protein [Leptospiraceae bacterium]